MFSVSCGKCNFCKPGFTNCSNKCIKDIINCQIGDACKQKCTKCNPGFYLLDGICTVIETNIENCLDYADKNKCFACKGNYDLKEENDIQTCVKQSEEKISLNLKEKEKEKIPTIENCLIYGGRYHSCSKCLNKKDLFFYKLNTINPYRISEINFLENAHSNKFLENTTDILTSFNGLLTFNNLVNINNLCQAFEINNCLEINENYQDCKVCASNYYLLDGKCVRYEQPLYEGCTSYVADSSKSIINKFDGLKCIACKSNYYLTINNNCVKFDLIEGCKNYSADHKICETCNNLEGHKILNNKCTKILKFKKVTNCGEYYENGENEGKCKSCSDSKIFDLVNNVCNNIINCAEIKNTDGVYTCNLCNKGYKITDDKKQCIKLDENLNCIENKDQNSDECTVCKEGYFPDKNDRFICKKTRDGVDYSANCLEGQENYKCNKAKPDYHNSQNIYECMPKINECLFYDNEKNNYCQICNNSLIQDASGGCTKEVTNKIENCIVYSIDGTTCLECVKDKFLFSNSCTDSSISKAHGKLCKYNPLYNIGVGRISSTITLKDNNTYTPSNYCKTCLNLDLLPESDSSEQCIPRLSKDSEKPFEDGTCKSNQIRVQYEFTGNSIRTCRNIDSIIGDIYVKDEFCVYYTPNKNELNNYKSASITSLENRICLFCKAGYLVDETGKCTLVTNALPDLESNNYGIVTKCKAGFVLSIDNLTCTAGGIINCKTYLSSSCIECKENYYGILATNSSSMNISTFNKIVVGIYSPIFLVLSKIDSNNIRRDFYNYFYQSPNFNFTKCLNVPLKYVNNGLSTSGTHDINDVSGVLIVTTSFLTIPAYCRKGYYMKMDPSKNNEWSCEKLGGTSIENLPFNNFYNQIISNNCPGNQKLTIKQDTIVGPFCIELTTGFHVTNAPQKININSIDGCLIYYLNVQGNADSTNVTTKRDCLLCEPGLYGSNCSNFTSFTSGDPVLNMICKAWQGDKCISCENGYSIVNNVCIINNSVIYTPTNLTVETYLSENNCKTLNYKATSGLSTGTITPSTSLDSLGCSECKTGFVYDYVSKKCFKQNDFEFSDCLRTEHKKGCLLCKPDLMVFGKDIKHEFCVNTPEIGKFDPSKDTNCTKFKYRDDKKYECVSCKTGFTLLNKLCKPNITNCSLLKTESSCLTCGNGYYLENGECKKGNIHHCLTYENKYKCSSCENNYQIYGNNNQVACILINDIKSSFRNCEFVENQINSKNQYYCKCDSSRIPLNLSPVKDSIQLPNYIDNCIEYDSNNLTQCIKCNSEKFDNVYSNNKYILRNNVCVLRRQNEKIANCLIYNNNKVECSKCADKFYVTRHKTCESNPIGKENCSYPRKDGTCDLCMSNYYLNSQNICKEVEKERLVVNCYKYTQDQKCQICNRGFILDKNGLCVTLSSDSFIDDNNLCIFDTVEGYKDNKCTCISNRYYFNEKEKKCLFMDGCEIINSEGLCQLCQPKFYFDINEKICKIVQNTIKDCNYYLNETTCSKCKLNFVLFNNKCEVVIQSDRSSNCMEYEKESKCILCDAGFYTNGKNCEEKIPDSMYLSSYNDKEKAIMCKSGYSMTRDRKCENNTKSGSSAVKLFISLMVIILFN